MRIAPITIDQALCDKHLLGASIDHPKSWRRWISVLKAGFAVPLSPTEQVLFSEVSGDRPPPQKRVNELHIVVGRRTGKTRMAAASAVYIGAIEQHQLAPGEIGHVLLLAASRDQARVAFEYVVGFLEQSTFLNQEIEGITQNEVRLKNRVVIGVHAGSFRTIRGRTLLAVVGDEMSFWRDESSAQPDVEIFRASPPALASTKGMWISISTGYKKAGLLYTKWKQHFGQPSDAVLIIQGGTSQFNETLDTDVIERARADDPEAYESEWLGGFRSDIAAFLDEGTIEKAIEYARPLELPPRVGITYRAFVDASGRRGDAYCVAIAHAGPERHVIDVVRGATPPFDPQLVTQEFARLCREYRVYEIVGDAYAGEWTQGAWEKCGVRYKRSEANKSQLYLEALPSFSRGIVRLPDHPRLLRELRLLERQTHRSGRDTIDLPRGGTITPTLRVES